VTGSKAYDAAVEAPALAPLWRALVLAVLTGGLAYWVSLGARLGG
jgi:hypothetical protein